MFVFGFFEPYPHIKMWIPEESENHSYTLSILEFDSETEDLSQPRGEANHRERQEGAASGDRVLEPVDQKLRSCQALDGALKHRRLQVWVLRAELLKPRAQFGLSTTLGTKVSPCLFYVFFVPLVFISLGARLCKFSNYETLKVVEISPNHPKPITNYPASPLRCGFSPLRNFGSFGKMDPFVVVERVKSPHLTGQSFECLILGQYCEP